MVMAFGASAAFPIVTVPVSRRAATREGKVKVWNLRDIKTSL
jgi:hypothetical protein